MATERLVLEVRTVGTQRTERNIHRLGAASASASRNVGLLRDTLAQLRSLLVVVASVRVLSGLVSTFIDFSDAMGTVRGVTGATSVEFEQLTAKARELGATTRFTAVQAAEGMTNLARAGLNASEILATVEGQLLLARVGNLDLGEAADIATNVLLGFGLGVRDLSDVLDVLAFTANRSNTTVQQLGQAFKFVAPIASASGISVRETASSLAVLAQQGIRADMAGTGVARVLARLESPSTKTKKAMDALGISLDQIRPSTVGFRQALETLGQSGLSAGAILELLGDRAGRTAVAILQQRNLLDEYSGELDDVTGFMKKTAEEMLNLKDDALEVVSAFDEVIQSLRDVGGEEALSGFLQSITRLLRLMSSNIDSVVLSLATFTGILAGAALLRFAAPLLLIHRRIVAIGVALAANPLGLLVTGAALAAGTLTLLQDELELTEDGTVVLRDSLDAFGTTIGEEIVGAVNSLGGEFENFDEIVKRVLDDAARGFALLLADIVGVVRAIKAAFEMNIEDVIPLLFEKVINGIIADFERGVNRLITGFNFLSSFVDGPTIDPLTLDPISLTDAREAGQTIGEAFIEGRNEVLQRTLANAEQRRIVEQLEASTAARQRRFAEAPPGQTDPLAGTPLGETTLDDLLGDGQKIEKVRTALERLLGSTNAYLDGVLELKDATETLNDAREAGIDIMSEFGVTEQQVLQQVAADILNVQDSERALAQQLQLVTKFQDEMLISARQAAIARRQFALEARQEFDRTLGAVFPLIESQRELAEIQLFLDKNQKLLRQSGIDEAEAKRRMAREALGLGQTIEQLNEEMQFLIDNQELLGLTSEELSAALRRQNIAFLETQRDGVSGMSRAYLKLLDDATNTAKFTEQVFTDAFDAMGEQLLNFIQTGTVSFDEFFRNLAAQLLRLGSQQFVAGIGGLFQNLLGATGASGGGGLYGGITGAGGGFNVGSFFTSLLGFNRGGSFTVGANTAVQSIPGIDNRLVAFRARDGEDVTVTPKNQSGAAMAPQVTQVFNIETRDSNSFRMSQSQIQNRALAGLNRARVQR